MQHRRGRTIFVASLSMAVLVFLSAAPLLKDLLLEAWYIHKLHSPENCDDAADYLGRVRSLRAIPSLVMVMKVERAHMGPPGHAAARNALVRIGAAAVPALAAALGDEDRDTRMHAASTLSEMGPSAVGAIDALADALQDTEEYVSGNAAYTLGRLRSEASVAPLMEALKAGDERLRKSAARALGEIGPAAKAAIPVLVDALSADPLIWEATEVIQAIGKIGPEARAAVPALIRILDSELAEESGSCRTSAVSLGQIGSDARDAVPTLTKALSAKDEWVCAHAAEALGRIGKDAQQALAQLERVLMDPPQRPVGAQLAYVSPNIPVIVREAMERIRAGKDKGEAISGQR